MSMLLCAVPSLGDGRVDCILWWPQEGCLSDHLFFLGGLTALQMLQRQCCERHLLSCVPEGHPTSLGVCDLSISAVLLGSGVCSCHGCILVLLRSLEKILLVLMLGSSDCGVSCHFQDKPTGSLLLVLSQRTAVLLPFSCHLWCPPSLGVGSNH